MKKNEYKECIRILERLHSSHPTYTISQHISTAMADYGEFWGLTDREFKFALEKYMNELELDIQHVVSEDYVQRVVRDANNLFAETDGIDEEEF